MVLGYSGGSIFFTDPQPAILETVFAEEGTPEPLNSEPAPQARTHPHTAIADASAYVLLAADNDLRLLAVRMDAARFAVAKRLEGAKLLLGHSNLVHEPFASYLRQLASKPTWPAFDLPKCQ